MPLPSGRFLHLGERPLVMGVLNVTPDSFADEKPLDTAHAIEAAQRMEEQGADIVDVGGESTRPGADPVPAAEEWARIAPVLSALAARIRIPLSVDTYKSDVARAALGEGASIINDVSSLRFDPALAAEVARGEAALVLMHSRGRSKMMYADAGYADVISEVAGELRQAMAAAVAAGVDTNRLIVDPGIGFAKRPAHSYVVLARATELATTLGRPVLVGPSRKSFMRGALADLPAPGRDWGTAAAVAWAVIGGAHIIRVHAVREMVQVVRVAEEIRRALLDTGSELDGSSSNGKLD